MRCVDWSICEGGASGIGAETVRVLTLRGAHVVIAARNLGAAREAKEQIEKDNPDARIDILKLDLSSIKSVRAFVDEFNALHLPLNLLVYSLSLLFNSCCMKY